MKKGTIVTLVLAAGFIALLLYSTLAAQQVECTACISFNGRDNCATASAENETEALRSAVNTACGPLTTGMDESIRCAGLPPLKPQCRAR